MSNEGFPSFSGENFENAPDRSTSQARGDMTLQAAKSQEQKPDLRTAQEAYQKEIFDKMDECRRLAEGIYADLRRKNAQQESAKNKVNVSPDKAKELSKKVNNNNGFKKLSKKLSKKLPKRVFIGGALVGVAGALAFTFMSKFKNDQSLNQQPAAVESESAGDNDLSPVQVEGIGEWGETSQYAGEMPNGVRYDYTEYFDYDNKKSHNSFGYDYSEQYGDEDATKNQINSEIMDDPEILASNVYLAFPESKKAEYGISGLGMGQIDESLDGEYGGKKKKKLQEEMQSAIYNENTTWEYKIVNGEQKTIYTYCEDDNSDNPKGKHLEWDIKDRHDAKQVTATYAFVVTDADGQEHLEYTTVTYNLDCGYQEVVDIVPEDIRRTPESGIESTGNESAGNESAGNESAGNESAGNESAGNESAGNESAGNESAGNESAGNESTGNESAGNESAGNESAGNESAGNESAGNEGSGFEGTNLTPKNTEAEIKNDGERADQQALNQEVTPPTDVKQDQANFEKIEQQKQDNAAKAEADRQAAAAQAEAEKQSAAEAEQRRQQEAAAEAERQAEADRQAAAEAAAKAQAEAEAKAQAEAEAERQRAAEQAAREQAQREAAERAAAERPAAEAASTNDEARDAADFANGAFDLNS